MTKNRTISRRQFNQGMAAAAAVASTLVAAPRLARAAADLRILTWEGYADDTWKKPFEAAHGVTCNVSYVGSVDEMFAKMQRSKGADYDVVAFDTSSFKRYLEQNLIHEIEFSKLPHVANLPAAFQNVAPTMKDGKHYGIPFAWGSLPLIYDKKAFPNGAPDSWNVMWDPQYAQQMIALDD